MKKIRWGCINLPYTEATGHFLVAGTTGSGKSRLINILMNSVLTESQGQNLRAIVYDAKQEIVPYLYSMRLGNRVKLLHPFDQRSHAWDIAKDIDDPVSALQLANILIPEASNNRQKETFFTDAVRDVLYGVLLAFIKCAPRPRSWTFRDVILTMLYTPYLRAILQLDTTREGDKFPYTARIRASYLEGDIRTVSNILATINTHLAIFEPVAAVWHRASNAPVSLRNWLGSEDVLVLGNDETSRAAIDTINRALFKRLTELILNAPETPDARLEQGADVTWVFLDEVREAGVLNGLSRLLTKGRSKGACVVLGFQDIEGLRDVYGDKVANELTGQCTNMILLRMSSPATAEWASDLFGQHMAEVIDLGDQVTDGGITISRGRRQQEQRKVQTSEFLFLPKPNRDRGLEGIYRNNLLSENAEYRHSLSGQKIDEASPRASKSPGEQNFIPRLSDEQYLLPWDQSDWKRLGFDGPVPSLYESRKAPGSQQAVQTHPPQKQCGGLRDMSGL